MIKSVHSMRFYLTLLPWIFGCLITNTFAHVASHNKAIQTESYPKPFMTLSLGPDFIQQGRAQTLILYPPFANHYTNKKSTTTAIDGGVFIGFENDMTEKTLLQFGISGYLDQRINPKGNVWLFASPLFETLAYQYHVRHGRVVAEGKLLLKTPQNTLWHPYLSVNLGAAFNQASDYQETPLIAGAVPTQPFVGHTSTSFTYGLGAGFDFFMTHNLRLGMGYQFADFGAVSFGPTTAAITSQTLSFPHLYTNQVRFQLSILK